MKAKGKNSGRFLLLLGLVTGLWLLGGCNTAELNERTLVSMIGIDRHGEEGVKITVGLISTSQGEKGSVGTENMTIYSSEGATIYDAIRKLVLKIGNQPLWPYIKIIVYGPSISKKDVIPILDYFNRNNEIQPNPYIVFSRTAAEDIVRTKTDLSKIPTIIVEREIERQDLLSFAPQVELYQFTEMMFSPEKVGYAALIEKEWSDDKHILKVEGMAVLKGARWIGELNRYETRGVLWVNRKVNGGIIEATVDGTKIALEILSKNKSSVRPVLRDGAISAAVDIKCRVQIGEVFGYLNEDQAILSRIQESAETAIREEIESSLQKTQKKWKTDIYGIGHAVERQYPAYWKANQDRWGELFGAMPIEVKVTANIEKMGLFESFSRK